MLFSLFVYTLVSVVCCLLLLISSAYVLLQHTEYKMFMLLLLHPNVHMFWPVCASNHVFEMTLKSGCSKNSELDDGNSGFVIKETPCQLIYVN